MKEIHIVYLKKEKKDASCRLGVLGVRYLTGDKVNVISSTVIGKNELVENMLIKHQNTLMSRV